MDKQVWVSPGDIEADPRVVKESLDGQIDDPVGTPAPLPRDADSIMRRLARTVPIRVLVKMRFHDGFEHHLDNGLRNAITHCRYTQRSAPPLRIGTLPLVGLPLAGSPFTSERQVPTFRTRAWTGLAPPPCRLSPGQDTGVPQATSRGRGTTPISTAFIYFQHVISGSLSFAFPEHT